VLALNNYLPSSEEIEKTHKIRDYLLRFVRFTIAEKNIEGKVMAVGSTAKDTFVRADTDIDIFIVSPNYQKAYELLKQKLPLGRRKEGPMDIWHFIYEGYDVDLVFIPPDHPRIETLIHTEFMNQNLTLQLKREAIRAKAFFKSQGVYGAEIGGIVGIAVEELVRRYGRIEKVCETLLSTSEIPFVPDPAKPDRNLLASLKKVRWKQLREACRKFLATHEFRYETYTKQDFLSQRETWTHLHFQRKRERPIDFHTALSACNHSLNEIKNREPEVKGTCDAYVFDEVIVSYNINPKTLPKQKIHCGPSIEMPQAVKAFKTIHTNTFEKEGKICTVVERERTNVVEWMQDLIADRMQRVGYTVI
jgi:tRNA nucleotidyltransferase (CCA-adding enzyme)